MGCKPYVSQTVASPASTEELRILPMPMEVEMLLDREDRIASGKFMGLDMLKLRDLMPGAVKTVAMNMSAI